MTLTSNSFQRSKVGFIVDTDGSAGGLSVTLNANLTLDIAAGSYWLGGRYFTITAKQVTLSAGHATLNRYDVVYIDESGTPAVKEGTPASSASLPTVRDDVLLLAQVYVAAGATSVTGANIQSLRDISFYTTSLSPPIGSIMAWAKTLTGVPALPSGWVQCDGQTLSDAASLLNGQVIPNLNGGARFLQGAATSGSTGGSANHTHTMAHTHLVSGNTGNYTPVGTSAGSGVATVTVAHNHSVSITSGAGSNETTSSVDTRPLFYSVVWIMRVK